MRNSPEHCPFLNRADERCSRHFTITQLQHAFKFCFDQYAQCPVYGELLTERRMRRGMREHHEPLVQVTITHRHAQHAARAAGTPAASGV